MLPLFKVCVNEPTLSVYSNFPRHSLAYPVPALCRFRRRRKRAFPPISLEPRYSRSTPSRRTPATRISYSRKHWGPRICRGLRHRGARQMTNWNVVGDAGIGISRHECQEPHSIGDSLIELHPSVKYVDIVAEKKRFRQDAKTLNPAASDYQRSCRETMRRKATSRMPQERDIMRRSCLAKLSRVKAPHIEIGNPASRKPFAV